MVTFACLSFVLYQSHECWLKYYTLPKSTDVSIQKAESYPEVTLCPKDLKVYNDFLQKCNLSYSDYFSSYKWTGNDSCKDPQILWNTMVGNINDLVISVLMKSNDNTYIWTYGMDLGNSFRTLDAGLHGRCYTLNWPKMLDLSSLEIVLNHEAKVHIHPPGEFFGSESAVFNLYGHTKIKLLYETFEVLDNNGDICIKNPNESRDDCLLNAIQQESKMDIGCTVPYIPDNSEICVKHDEASNASYLFGDITEWNQTKSQKLCPKTCLQYTISVGNKDLINDENTPNIILTLDFPKLIKVSRTYLSYTILELIAEVGGYVGLFLGVSINQISDLFRIMIGKLSPQL